MRKYLALALLACLAACSSLGPQLTRSDGSEVIPPPDKPATTLVGTRDAGHGNKDANASAGNR